MDEASTFVVEIILAHWVIYVAIFVLTIIYAFILQKWQYDWPENYDEMIWFQTVIGCGYILILMGFIIPLKYWVMICAGFFFASLPIIFRAIYNSGNHRREASNSVEENHDAR